MPVEEIVGGPPKKEAADSVQRFEPGSRSNVSSKIVTGAAAAVMANTQHEAADLVITSKFNGWLTRLMP